MTDKVRDIHWAVRRHNTDCIIEAAELYKVCDQCRSIFSRKAGICTVCGTYRFDETPERVRETAQLGASVPFPFTEAVVPRIISRIVKRRPADQETPSFKAHE